MILKRYPERDRGGLLLPAQRARRAALAAPGAALARRQAGREDERLRRGRRRDGAAVAGQPGLHRPQPLAEPRRRRPTRPPTCSSTSTRPTGCPSTGWSRRPCSCATRSRRRACAATRAPRGPAACTSWCRSSPGPPSRPCACSRRIVSRGAGARAPGPGHDADPGGRARPAGLPRPQPERARAQHLQRLLGAAAPGRAGGHAAAVGRGAPRAGPPRLHDGRGGGARGARRRSGRGAPHRPPGPGRRGGPARAPGPGEGGAPGAGGGPRGPGPGGGGLLPAAIRPLPGSRPPRWGPATSWAGTPPGWARRWTSSDRTPPRGRCARPWRPTRAGGAGRRWWRSPRWSTTGPRPSRRRGSWP